MNKQQQSSLAGNHQTLERPSRSQLTGPALERDHDLSKIQEELELDLEQSSASSSALHQQQPSFSTIDTTNKQRASALTYTERIRHKLSSMVNPKKQKHFHQQEEAVGLNQETREFSMNSSACDQYKQTIQKHNNELVTNVHANMLHDSNVLQQQQQQQHQLQQHQQQHQQQQRYAMTNATATNSGDNYLADNSQFRNAAMASSSSPASATTSLINNKQLHNNNNNNNNMTSDNNSECSMLFNSNNRDNRLTNNSYNQPNATSFKVVACPDGHSFKQVVVSNPKFNTSSTSAASNTQNILNSTPNSNTANQNNQSSNQNTANTTNTTTTTTTTTTTGNIRSPDGSSSLNSSALNSCAMSKSSSEIRLRWGKKMDFLLSIIGFAVDLANIWRFPYLCYKNGGGVFLIPYIIMLIFGGIPLFFLELLLGQFVKKGPITVWNKICPSMKGVGYCSILISWYVSFYYNVLIAWSVYFIYRSISSTAKMPWEECNHDWNNATCMSIRQLRDLCSPKNMSLEACKAELFSQREITSPAQEFFVKELLELDKSTGLEDMGYLRPGLVVCTFVVYVLHFFSLFRGLETSGKVVWVTATAPYMILTVLLVRGLFLPGAGMGIAYYLSPRLEKLADPQVWVDAAGQVFYSIGVGFGVHLTYASFNGHNNNCYRDCLVTSAVNAATSIYSGLVVFVYLGYMATNLGIEIDKVAKEGYSLVFEVYPEALTTLPFAQFWSILFFIMLLTLGIDSAMGGLEAVITGLEDEFKIARRLTRGQLTFIVIASSFFPALISCTQGGAYTMYWFDVYSAGVSLLFSALFEAIGVVYCYGLAKFIPNIESMLGKKPHLFYIVCWKYISPLFLGVVIAMSIFSAETPVYRGYKFPVWSVVAGWTLAFSSVSAIPIVAGATWIRYWRAKKPKQTSNNNNNNNKRRRRATDQTMFTAIENSKAVSNNSTPAAGSIKSKSIQYAQQRFELIFIKPINIFVL